MAAAPRFEGFGPHAHDFFVELAAHNAKSWFDEHRQQYQDEIKVPFELLLAELEPTYGPGKVFRINRDTRFSKDKTPYKTAQAAMIPRGAKGTVYLEVSGTGVMAGTGVPHLDAGQLARWREAVAGPAGDELEDLIDDLTRRRIVTGTFGPEGVGPEGDLKRVPPPYPKDHPRGDLLRLKRFVAVQTWDRPAWTTSRRALQEVTKAWGHMEPLAEWLATHVGEADPPAEDDPRRNRRRSTSSR